MIFDGTLVTNILLAATLIAATSFSGALFTAGILKKQFSRWQALLVSFASGVFVVAGSVLLYEGIELAGWVQALSYGLGSIAVFHILSLVWPEHHHHHSDAGHCDHCEPNLPKKNIARRLLVGDSIHNVIDGMLLVSAFLVDTTFGLFAVLAIWLHEVVQEVSEYVVFRSAGYSARKALTMNGLSALTIFIGVGIALAANELVSNIEGPLLSIAGGAFLYIALRDLIPHSVRHTKMNKKYVRHIAAFLLGVLLMFLTGQIAPHQHGGGETHGHDHDHGHGDHEHDEEMLHDDQETHPEDHDDHLHE